MSSLRDCFIRELWIVFSRKAHTARNRDWGAPGTWSDRHKPHNCQRQAIVGHLRYSMALLKKIVSCQWSVVRKTGARPQVSSFEGTEKSRREVRFRRSERYEGNRNFPFWESSCQLSVVSEPTKECAVGEENPRSSFA